MINFNKIITQHIEEELDKSEWGEDDTDDTYHPSTLGLCPRQMLIAKSKLKDPNRALKGVFYLGNMYHKLLQFLVLKEGESELFTSLNVKYHELDFIIKGHADFVDKDNIVYDFKTKSSFRYLGNNIQSEHKIQAMIYMHMLKSKVGCIIYVNKSTFETRQISFNYDSSLIEQVYEKVRKFHPIYLKWKKENSKLENIPFNKCKCMYCKYE